MSTGGKINAQHKSFGLKLDKNFNRFTNSDLFLTLEYSQYRPEISLPDNDIDVPVKDRCISEIKPEVLNTTGVRSNLEGSTLRFYNHYKITTPIGSQGVSHHSMKAAVSLVSTTCYHELQKVE